MARRRKGEGTIYQRDDGRWVGMVDLGRTETGQRQRKAIYAATEHALVRKMKQLHGRQVSGGTLQSSSPTVATFLEMWFQTKADGWTASTQRSYRGAIDLYLSPAFGRKRLEALSPLEIQAWLTTQKTTHGARRRINLAHAVLRSALSEARRLQLIGSNPAAGVTIPRLSTPRVIAPLTETQVKVFLEAATQHRLGALFTVGLACGLRLGEVTGLQWDAINLETGELRVERQLQLVGPKGARRLTLVKVKTAKSHRTLMLPAVCLEALRRRRRDQQEERLKAGRMWIDTGLVFTTYAKRGEGRFVGCGMHPRRVSRILETILQAAGLPHIRFHDLRHSAASLLLAEGVSLGQVSELLGHSELRVTQDLYNHLMKKTATRAAAVMDRILG